MYLSSCAWLTCLCRFHSCINQTFSPSHSMEKELGRSKASQVWVFYETSWFWTIIVFDEVRKGSLPKSEGNTFTFNVLLTHTSNNLKSSPCIRNNAISNYTQMHKKRTDMQAQKHSSYQCNSTQCTLQSFHWELLDHTSVCMGHWSGAWGHCQFHNNEEAETVLCGWLQMQKPHFH